MTACVNSLVCVLKNEGLWMC